MKKLRTKTMLTDALDDDISWRIKEISDVKDAIRVAEQTARRSIIRAGVPILYAHWEGFIKYGSECVLNYVNNQGLALRALHPCFVVYGAKRKIRTIIESGSATDNVEVVEFFLNKLDQRAELSTIGSVNTESNLSSEIFERIARSLGIDVSAYETKYVFINKSLLEKRNEIAHGKFLDVEQDDFRKLADEVIVLLRNYKTDLENIVQAGRYLAPAVPPQPLAAGT